MKGGREGIARWRGIRGKDKGEMIVGVEGVLVEILK